MSIAVGVLAGCSSPPTRTPTKILITPPDETHSAVLDWPGGAVFRQDGATRPAT